MTTPWSNQANTLIILIEQITGQSGMFGYSPDAGPGNLTLSISAKGGTDQYGNEYQVGIVAYGTEGSYAQLSENDGTAILYLRPSGLIYSSIIPGITSGAGNQGEINEYTYIQMTSGSEAGTPLDQVVLNMFSAANDGSAAAQIALVFPDGQRMLFIEAGGFAPGEAIMTGNLPINSTAQFESSPYQSSSTTAAALMGSWTIPANDANSNSVYRITVGGRGIQGSTAADFDFFLGINESGGTSPHLATCVLGAASIPANDDFGWRLSFDVVMYTAGSAATYGVFSVGAVEQSNSSNGQALAGQNATGNAAVNTTASWTLTVMGNWATAETNQVVIGFYSTLERLGP